jgi:mannan endo-1,6-alpha-mannosidase
MMTWYYGNETGQIPGAFPDKWWEGATLFLTLLQYWHFTGDTTYNSELSIGLQWQSGDSGDYMPSNYSSYLVSNPRSLKRYKCLIRFEGQ